jgi:hypothetical protein
VSDSLVGTDTPAGSDPLGKPLQWISNVQYSFDKIFTPFHSSDKDNESYNPSRKRDRVPPKMMRI